MTEYLILHSSRSRAAVKEAGLRGTTRSLCPPHTTSAAPLGRLAAVDRRLCAPLGGETPHCGVGVLIEAEEVADDAPVQEGAVGVGVREVGGLQVFVTELVEDGLSRAQLLIREGAEVQHWREIRGADVMPALLDC